MVFLLAFFAFFVFALLFLLSLLKHLGPRRAVGADHRNVAVLTAEHAEEQPLAVGREARCHVLGGVVVVGQINHVRAVAIYEAEIVSPVLVVNKGDALAIGGNEGSWRAA